MTILTPERLAEIEALAKKATPGPWEGGEGAIYSIREAGGKIILSAYADVTCGRIHDDYYRCGNAKATVRVHLSPENKAYIAALYPQIVLALLASHAALQAEVERLRGHLDKRNEEYLTMNSHAADPQDELTTARESAAREMRERCANVAREYKKPVRPKPTIEELEVILAQDTDPGIEITPDGEVRAAGTHLGHDIAAAISALPLTPADGAKDE